MEEEQLDDTLFEIFEEAEAEEELVALKRRSFSSTGSHDLNSEDDHENENCNCVDLCSINCIDEDCNGDNCKIDSNPFDGSGVGTAPPALKRQKRRKNCGHRPLSEVWELISDGSVPLVHLQPTLLCRFCGSEVHTCAKPSRAIAHLKRKCEPGKAFLDSIPPDERTQFISDEFYPSAAPAPPVLPPSALAEVWHWLCNDPRMAEQSQKVQCKHCLTSFPCASQPEKALRHLSACWPARKYFSCLPESEQTPFIREHFPPARALPALCPAEQHRFSELLAMFVYSSDLPWDCLENPFLKEAMALCRPGLSLPGRRQLGGKLLHDAHAKAMDLLMLDGSDEQPIRSDGEAAGHGSSSRRRRAHDEKLGKVEFVRQHQALLGSTLGVNLPCPASSLSSSVTTSFSLSSSSNAGGSNPLPPPVSSGHLGKATTSSDPQSAAMDMDLGISSSIITV